MGWFDNLRAGTEHMIQEANNEAGWVAHPSGRIDINRNHFPLGGTPRRWVVRREKSCNIFKRRLDMDAEK